MLWNSFWFDVVAFNICLLRWKTAIGGKQCIQVAFGVIMWMYNYKLMYWYLESRRWRHGGQACKQIWSTSNWKQHFGPQLYIFFILCISFPFGKVGATISYWRSVSAFNRKTNNWGRWPCTMRKSGLAGIF